MATTDRDNNPPEAPFRDQAGNGVALLIVDMINQFDFAGAEALLPRALEVAKKIDALRQAAHRQLFCEPRGPVASGFPRWEPSWS